MAKKHVAVLMGGLSAEREVSLVSGKGVCKALEELGYKVSQVDPDKNVSSVLQKLEPDVVFNALHGTYGEDGCIQGLLEILRIPYTHSGVLASALAFNKREAKYLFKNVDILCPPGKTISKKDILEGKILIKKPYVIKPVSEGSSVGVYIITEDMELNLKPADLNYEEYLVEKYIPGKELSVAVTDDKPLGVMELRPKDGFYDYKNKYTTGMTEHIMPAPIDKRVYDEAMLIAFKAHKAIGGRGISRSDFRYDEDGDGKLYLLEINTHPGMTPLSIAPEIAKYAKISFNELVEYLVGQAKCEK